MMLPDPEFNKYKKTCIKHGELTEHDVATFVWIAHGGGLVKETEFFDDWKLLLDSD
jgi:hypothetical protein